MNRRCNTEFYALRDYYYYYYTAGNAPYVSLIKNESQARKTVTRLGWKKIDYRSEFWDYV